MEQDLCGYKRSVGTALKFGLHHTSFCLCPALTSCSSSARGWYLLKLLEVEIVSISSVSAKVGSSWGRYCSLC